MQRSWPNFYYFAILLVLTGILWDNSRAWASPDQSPARQTVPTRVITDTPVAIPPTSIPPINTLNPDPPEDAHPTSTQMKLPTYTQTSTSSSTQSAPTLTATLPPSTVTKVKPTVIAVSATETVVPLASPTSGGNASFIWIGGILAVILAALIFGLRRSGSR